MDRASARRALGWILLLLLALLLAADLLVLPHSTIREAWRSIGRKKPTPVERIIKDLRP